MNENTSDIGLSSSSAKNEPIFSLNSKDGVSNGSAPNFKKFFSIAFKSCFFKTNFLFQRSSNPDGKEGYAKIWYYEYNTDVVLPLTDFRKIQGVGIDDIDALPFPYKCQAKYMADQKWYDAEVKAKGVFGYRITYTKYGHSEEVPCQYLKKYPLKHDSKEVFEAKEFVIPPNLIISPTDSEEEKKRKKKKVKYLKSKFAEKNDELESKAVQSSWQAFVNKGVKKNITGFKKTSMFAAPSTIEGKVGVTNSGSNMTEYSSKKRSFQSL